MVREKGAASVELQAVNDEHHETTERLAITMQKLCDESKMV